MKVRISYTIDVSDEYRRIMADHFGMDGLATRAMIQEWFRGRGDDNGTMELDDMLLDEQQWHERQERDA